MKRSLKKRVKNWKIGDYIRQFSIVVGGVLLTLWLTGHIAESSKQKEVRQALQLITLELQNNLQTVRDYEQVYGDEKYMALRLQAEGFSIEHLPADTVMLYQQRLYGGMVRPFNFSTNALEMLKTSGLASHIVDKQLVIDLLHCYGSIESFDNTMDFYYNMRKESISGYDKKHPRTSMPTQTEDFIAIFGEVITDVDFQNWLCALPRAFDTAFFEVYKSELQTTVGKLEAACK